MIRNIIQKKISASSWYKCVTQIEVKKRAPIFFEPRTPGHIFHRPTFKMWQINIVKINYNNKKQKQHKNAKLIINTTEVIYFFHANVDIIINNCFLNYLFFLCGPATNLSNRCRAVVRRLGTTAIRGRSRFSVRITKINRLGAVK